MTSAVVRRRPARGVAGAFATARAAARSETGVMVCAFVVLRLVATLHSPQPYPDTVTYELLNFSGDAVRLWTVPLIWNLFPGADLHIAVQIALGMFAWSMLAVSVSRTISQDWVRRLATLAVLILGLVVQVTGWDATLLSESTSLSLMVLEVALIIRLGSGASARLLGASVAVAGLWMFTRQVNVLLYVALLPFAAGFALAWLPRRRALLTILATVLLGGWGVFAISRDTPAADEVWHSNALGIIVNQIARDPAALGYFAAHGLPESPELVRERGRFLGGDSPLFRDTRLMQWVQNHFRQTYFTYLLRHPRHALWDPISQIPVLASAPLPEGRATAVLPDPIAQIVWSRTEGDIIFWGVVALAVLLVAWSSGARNRLLVLPVILAIAGGLMAIASLDTSAVDPYRYFIPVGLLVRLGLLLAIGFGADAALITSRRRTPSPP